jgi:hypothetical protein
MASALYAAFAAAPLHAQDRSFCAERPGMGKPACTVGPGQAIVEVTALAFDHMADPAGDIDAITLADTLLRLGLDDRTELQLGLTGYVRTLLPDPASPGGRLHGGGVGDSYVAIRHSLTDAGPIAAIEGYVSLPTGDPAVSAGTWGAGLVLPIDLTSIGGAALSLTPEIDAAPNASGSGRHLAYGAVLGVSGELLRNLGGSLEVAADQDDAPEGASFVSKVAGSLAWQAADNLQFNLEVDVSVVAPAPRTQAFVGFALRL